MYSKILIPLDGSKVSESVLPYARWLAKGLKLPVDLLYVNDPDQPASCAPFMAGEYLESIASSFGGEAALLARVEAGNAAAKIIELAAAEPELLIAMATHGYSGAKLWLLGSVAEKVLRGAANHVLLVHPSDGAAPVDGKLTTMLVPLDGSQLAEEVLPTVGELASRLSLQVVLVRVTRRIYSAPPEAFLPVFGANAPNLKKLWAEAGAEASEYLARTVEELRPQGLTQVTPLVLDSGVDGAAAAIIDLVKNTPEIFVAMCTHGESGIGSWLVGSVTERVVRHTAVPVLVIRPK
jgi:nucleotide-binding universal stress UspA family protein